MYNNVVSSAAAGPNADYLSRADAWIVSMHSLFDEARAGSNEFFTIFERRAQKVMELLPDKAAAMNTNDIRFLFGDSNFSKMPCHFVITFGQICGFWPPSDTIANLAWLGVDNYDGWARGTSVHAAAAQWYVVGKENETVRRRAVGMLSQWLSEAIEKYQTGTAHYKNEGPLLDIAAAVGGLCLCGALEQAVQTVDDNWDNLDLAPLFILVIIVFAVDTAPSRAEELIEKYWARIPDFNFKDRVSDYVADVSGFAEMKVDLPDSKDASLCGVIAASSFSNKFLTYLKKHESTRAIPFGSTVFSSEMQMYEEIISRWVS